MHVDESSRVATVEDFQTPRHRGLAAEKLLVEVVSDPTDSLRENDARCDRVAERRKRNATTPAGDPGAPPARGARPPTPRAPPQEPRRPIRPRPPPAKIRPPVGRQVIQAPADEAE